MTSNELKACDEEALEAAYWQFDNARLKKEYSERDCFKHQMRQFARLHMNTRTVPMQGNTPLAEQGCVHCNPIKRYKLLGDPRDTVSAPIKKDIYER